MAKSESQPLYPEKLSLIKHELHNFDQIKVLMQGKLISVAYTLRTYWNQFFLGGICKQE